MSALRRFRRPFREQRDPERWRELEARFDQHQQQNQSVWFGSAWSFVLGFAESVLSANELRRQVGPDQRPLERFEFENPSVRRSPFNNGPFIQ